ncbi:MAG: tetratricopeptide repeat protein [bacterium]
MNNQEVDMRVILLAMGLSLVLVGSVFAQGGHKQVQEGNRLYSEEKYDEANNKYRDALIENPESPVINFNIGYVQYKKRNFEEALKAYEAATSSDDILTQSQGYYNIGNTLYRLGKLPESILAYKKALELNPNDEDAKYNLEYVRAKLKDNSEKQPQENQQQKQDQQNQEQNQDQNNQEQQEGQQQQQQQDSSEDDQQNQEEQQQQEGEATEEKEISKEDAERILDALKNQEQDLLKQQKPKKRRRAFRGKDW